jgi:AbiV family abortive infection protein
MNDSSAAAKNLKLRQDCLDHARDLLAAAERVFVDEAFANIAYHLGILALEEIGKAGMFGARAVLGDKRSTDWMEKRFDDHVWKMMWAVWSGGLSSGKIDPKDFEQARRFAASSHQRRLAGLYVDQNGVSIPRDVVNVGHTRSIIDLAQAKLELDMAGGPVVEEPDENVEWFLDTMSDELGARTLLSTRFLERYEQLNGDTRSWVVWCREEIAKTTAAAEAKLKIELARAASTPQAALPKWQVRVRLVSLTHSIRPKPLKVWNSRINWMQLSVGAKKDEIFLDLTIHDNVTLPNLFDAGMQFSKLCIAALNIGSLGLIWYEWPRQTNRYHESIKDLAEHDHVVEIRKGPRFAERRLALEDKHLHHATQCIAAFGIMREAEAEPIFGPYLHGLVLLSKCDVHLSCEDQAFDAFMSALHHALKQFDNWDGDENSIMTSLHKILSPIVPEETHRNTMLACLNAKKDKVRPEFGDALAAKQVADIYLVLVADRLWKRRMSSATTS